MKILLLLLSTFALTASIFAQSEIIYNNPPSIKTSDYRVDALDIVATEDYCKLKLIVENSTSDAYFLFTTDELGFNYPEIGTYWPKKSNEFIVHPNDKESDVIEIKGDMDYRKDHFDLMVNGLKKGTSSGFLAKKSHTIKMEQESSMTFEGVKFTVVKSSSKRGKIKLQIEVEYTSEEDDMIVFDPASLSFSSNGEPIVIAKSSAGLVSFGNKPVTLRPGKNETLRYTLLSEEEVEIQCNTFEMFERFDFTSVDVDPVRIGYPKDTQFSEGSSSSTCDAFMGKETGAMRTKVYSPDGPCFKLDIEGFPVITSMTSNAIIFIDSGRRKYTLMTSDGKKTEGKITVPSTIDYTQIGYVIKEKKDGYVLKYKMKDQIMTDAAVQKRQDFFENAQSTSQESNSNTNDNNGTSSNTGNCFGPESTGTKTLSLKVTWKGSPVVGHGVEIRYGNTPIGNATTGSNGTAKIKSSKYDDGLPKVDVYGCKGNTTWSVTGDWVVFDNSGNFHLKLDEVAKVMSEMMGSSVEEIGAGWGM
jgi:hypothetical protein